MNRENLKKLRKVLRRVARTEKLYKGAGFNMAVWYCQKDKHECGTVACIAGYEVLRLHGPDYADRMFDINALAAIREAGASLGLSTYQRRALFTPAGFGSVISINANDAANAITRLLAANNEYDTQKDYYIWQDYINRVEQEKANARAK